MTTTWPVGVTVDELPNPSLAGWETWSGILDSDPETNSVWSRHRRPTGLRATVVDVVERDITERLVDEAEDVDSSRVTSPGLLACLDGTATCDEVLATYASLVECLDTHVGRLLADMSPATLATTLLVFAGDNGAPHEAAEWRFADPDLDGVPDSDRGKAGPYEAGVHVPLLVAEGRAWLGDGSDGLVVSPGREVSLPVHLMGLYPTLLRAVGGVSPEADAQPFLDCLGTAEPLCGRAS